MSFVTGSKSSESELRWRNAFCDAFDSCPIPRNERLNNLGMFVNRQLMSRFILMHDLYRMILGVHGIVIEFGVRWGQNMALFQSFRGMYEPFNYTRKIVGFDTFAGFPEVSPKDGECSVATKGAYSVTEGYESFLGDVLSYHESESPTSHIRKWELVKGDATKTFSEYLDARPETMVALAYFDFDLYLPTKKCLQLLINRVTKGSVIAFDELNCRDFPGETIALSEVLGINNVRIQRNSNNPTVSYFVVE